MALNDERSLVMSTLSVVIPSYNRGLILIDTIEQLLLQSVRANEIVIVDQTAYTPGDETAQKLLEFSNQGLIRWLCRDEPSIPKAMNYGLEHAASQWVLFLDDDIKVGTEFLSHHLNHLNSGEHQAHVGQVVQPWQQANQDIKHNTSSEGLYQDLEFSFNSREQSKLLNCMAGNLCVKRTAAIAAGGFDENFKGVAYRFETEFAKRFCKYHQTQIAYFPAARLNHLHVKSGGTRSHADVLRSTSPVHSMGDYYFALLHGEGAERITYIARRFIRSLCAKFYLRNPWYLPARIIAEVRGFFAALNCMRKGPALMSSALLVNATANSKANSEASTSSKAKN